MVNLANQRGLVYEEIYYYITNKDGKVVSKVTIDYSKIDIDKFVKENPAMKSYVNKYNQITLEGVKKMYESMGATCK